MNASFRSLRRAFAAGALATLTISAGGCFTVEQVAEEPQAGEASGEGGAAGEPDLSIAMGDEAGPLDLNVDATLGEVSAEDFSNKFGAADGVPHVPPALSPNQIPSAPTFPPQTVASESPAFEAPALPSNGGEYATAPALGGDFSASPTIQDAKVSPTPGLSESFAPPADFAEVESASSPTEGGLTPLVDPANIAAVEPMEDPETSLAEAAPAASLDFSASPAPSVAAGLEPTFDSAATSEFAPSPALLSGSAPSIADADVPESNGAEVVASPDLAAEAPAPPQSDASSESIPAPTFGELTPPAASAPEAESLAEAPSLRDAIGAVPVQADEPAATTDPAGSPFEEEDFAPRFGPGRHLAGSSPVAGVLDMRTPGAALLSGDEEGLSSVLAQESPSPAANSLAMQIFDPSAPPPASLRPTAGPNANLPAFDPTIGERLSPPAIGVDDFTPTPDDDSASAAPGPVVSPGPAARPAPRELPMPGPARDDAADEAVPAPPSVRTPSGVRASEPKESSTAEIAEASRDWTDASGSHTLKAAILEYDQGEVRLETPKGERYVVSLSSLSRYDQGYVKGLAEGTLGKPPVERTWSDDSGEFSLTGEFVEDAGDAVRIAKEDGKTFRIEKEELAEYDRGYVDGLTDAKE